MRKIFVTGIGTDVGKTIVSAILTEALQADYWKPIQTGLALDSKTVKALISNPKSIIHKESYLLKEPTSPHYAATLEDVEIQLKELKLPKTNNILIIEGAGGVMVPLNDTDLMVDLIKKLNAEVVLVVKNYLGSINHSLCTIEILKTRRIKILGIIVSGDENKSSEDFIIKNSGIKHLARIPHIAKLGKYSIAKYSKQFQSL